MSALAREAQNVQNPALGAALIWRFCCGFVNASPTREPPPFPVVFLVLPVVLHQPTNEFVRTTQLRSGLRAFAAKFGDAKASRQDLLWQIHERAARWRVLSLQSVEIAVATALLAITDDAQVVPMSRTPARGVPEEVRRLMKDAEKLGNWCGQLTIHEIASTLKVRL